MATLSDINQTLGLINSNVQNLIEERRRNRLQDLERQAEASRSSRSSAGGAAGGFLGSLSGGIGRGLGLATGGLAMAGALGLALPAFFGGLMAGESGLDWLASMGAGFDFDSLKAAAVGFSDIITSMDPNSFVVLAGIMGISALGGRRGAMGLGSMGIAISAFFGGLLAGEALFDGFSLMGADFNFNSLKEILTGFSSAILGLTPQAAVTIAALVGTAGFASVAAKKPTDVAVGLAAMSAGLIGLFGGILLAEGALDLAVSQGANLNFDSIKTIFEGFSNSVGALTTPAIIALGSIMAAATGISVLRGTRSATAALGFAAVMAGVGAGIAGFMFGLSAGDAGISWIQSISGATGDGLVSAFQMFNDSISVLSEPALLALAAILGTGTLIGAVSGVKGLTGGVGIFGILSGIGAGIAGLFVGLAAGGKIVDLIESIPGGDGDGLVSVFRQFNNSVVAITPEAIQRLRDLSSLGGLDIAGALGGLSAGVVAMFSAEGLVGIGQAIKDGVAGTIDFIFGTNLSDRQTPSVFQQMVDGLAPIKDFDIAPITTFTSAIDSLTDSFEKLASLDLGDRSTRNLSRLMTDIGNILSMMPFLLNGGTWPGQRLGRGDNINFGEGLQSLRSEDLDALKEGISALMSATGALSPIGGTATGALSPIGGTATGSGSISSTLQDLYVENLIAQNMSTPPIIINNVDNSSSTSGSATIRYDNTISPYDRDAYIRRGLVPQEIM